MGNVEDRVGRSAQRRRPISLESHIRARETIVRSHVFAGLVESGIPDEQADKLAREALRKARVDFARILSEDTKQDLRQIKIRR